MSAPSSPIPQATLDATHLRPATLTQVSSTKHRFCSSIEGSCYELKLSWLDQERKADLDAKVASVWDQATLLAKAQDPDAKRIRVHIGEERISYKDKSGKLQSIDLGNAADPRNEDIEDSIKKLKDLQKTIKTIWSWTQWTSNGENKCNRALSRERPLSMGLDSSKSPKTTWCNLSSEDFFKIPEIKNNSLPFNTPDGIKEELRVKNAERLIEELRKTASEKIKDQEKIVKQAEEAEKASIKKGEDPSDSLKKERNTLANLQALARSVQPYGRNGEGIDSFAIFAALCFKDDSNKITEVVSHSLFDKLSPLDNEQTDKRGVVNKMLNRAINSTPTRIPSKDEVRLYANEIGDLVIEDRMQYLERIDQCNQDPKKPNRSAKGASMEQWIVQYILNDSNNDLPEEDTFPQYLAFAQAIEDPKNMDLAAIEHAYNPIKTSVANANNDLEIAIEKGNLTAAQAACQDLLDITETEMFYFNHMNPDDAIWTQTFKKTLAEKISSHLHDTANLQKNKDLLEQILPASFDVGSKTRQTFLESLRNTRRSS